MFGGFPGMPGMMHPGMAPRPRPIGVPLQVTLEELLTGAQKEIDLDELISDDELKGYGVTGKLTVDVEPGMEDGDKIPIPGRGVKLPQLEEPGDIIVVLEQQPHPDFEREGADLLTKHCVSLVQALTGFSFELTHLDGRKLLLHHKPPEDGAPISTVSPTDRRVIPGEGMPLHESMLPPDAPPEIPRRGDLIISFEVAFPRVLDEEQLDALRKALPTRRMTSLVNPDLPIEERDLDDYDPLEWTKTGVGEDEEDDDEEDDQGGGGGPRFACAHQ
eukprot:TRINITY_DN1098_c1_g1_i1.p1 TRINITY_DN1098_c1_g1~~TRINITY_DN1098_c1_g1_i1.p1  ORF type:complete len:274 (+),score=87.93 TRINITY_DN1098_c1_g1_i1:88-909(+)